VTLLALAWNRYKARFPRGKHLVRLALAGALVWPLLG